MKIDLRDDIQEQTKPKDFPEKKYDIRIEYGNEDDYYKADDVDEDFKLQLVKLLNNKDKRFIGLTDRYGTKMISIQSITSVSIRKK
jgi:hypothetical protein